MTTKPSQEELTLNSLLKVYLETHNKLDKNTNGELEVRFGTRQISKITKNTFDNVVQYLLASNFKLTNQGQHYLSIKAEDIRCEIYNLINIQNYCKTNSLPTEYPQAGYKFNNKTTYMINPSTPARINFDQFNFRVTYSIENDIQPNTPEVQKIIQDWSSINKFNRLICRFSFENPDFPVRVDMSIVREAKATKNIRDTNIFKLNPKYEIEIEILNEKITDESPDKLEAILKKVSKYILSGLQGTNFPIPYSELNNIGDQYLQIINSSTTSKIISPSDFIGPSSITLQIPNIAPINTDSTIINVRTNYTVTDKADGDRKLLFINNKGKIFLITTQASIEFTGAETKNTELFNSILDGEHIKHNKLNSFINLYAAFDIYFINNKDVRTFEFTTSDKSSLPNKLRWNILDTTIKTLNPVETNTGKLSPIRIQIKQFYDVSPTQSVFAACKLIDNQIKTNQLEYETDGFIFTPKNLGVGLNTSEQRPKSYKHTWDHSFKWKPAEYNTIDFLITTKKNTNGIDIINNKFEDGTDTKALDQIIQYKTIILRVGYDIKKHGYINPCQNIIDDEIPIKSSIDKDERFRPVQFVPSNPYDPTAGIANIELKLDNMNERQMFTENEEVIEDNTIVECRYDISRPKGWRWIPIRIRYDKTAEYRAGYKNYGNAYHVAQNNWYSIHNPITLEMITTGENIPNELGDDDIYYNVVKGPKVLKAMRDFHNLFVKTILITSVSNPGDILIDYAVGKGGDLPKWINAKLSFVFGIDQSSDNIRNSIDGICARYLNYKQKFIDIPDALFVYGNSTKNIKDLSAIYSETGKQITKAVFGDGIKDEKILGKGVIKSFGKGQDGFNISSIQFALHYMFENTDTLQNFLTNISECTKLGGFLIGTCFDGAKIYRLLSNLKDGEIYTFFNRDNKKLLEITKKYSANEFNNDISSLGYAIDVFQSSINKTFREYLVNFDYLTSMLELFGFIPLTSSEIQEFNLNNSIGSFEDLYKIMNSDIKSKKLDKNDIGEAYKMSREERDISFLNNYFIFKKVRNVDIKDIKISLVQKTEQETIAEAKETLMAKEAVVNATIEMGETLAPTPTQEPLPDQTIKSDTQSSVKRSKKKVTITKGTKTT